MCFSRTNICKFYCYCSIFNDKGLVFNLKIKETKEVTKRTEAGLFAALFIAVIPSYMSRSVAGSYDNEGVSIFALVFCFYMFLKSVNTVIIYFSCYIPCLGINSMVNSLCSFIFLHGFNMGWLCLYYKYNSNFCAFLIYYRKIFNKIICILFNLLYYWNILCYAYTICWISSNSF